jgi:NADH:ubiquinone oxidoreductase subunit 2 (subunit N)
MLASSGEANASYILISLAVLPSQWQGSSGAANGGDAVLFYLVTYGTITLGPSP